MANLPSALLKPSTLLSSDLTFTVSDKGIVNISGNLKLDAASGSFITPNKPIKFGALNATDKAIDLSAAGIGVSGYWLYLSNSAYWTPAQLRTQYIYCDYVVSYNLYPEGNVALNIKGRASDGVGIVNIKMGSVAALTQARDRHLIKFYNDNLITEIAGINTQGEFEVFGAGLGIILKSPGGTRYVITVDDLGNLVTTAI